MGSFLLLIAIVFIGSVISIGVQLGFASSIIVLLGSVVVSLTIVAVLDWLVRKVRF